MLYTFDKVLPFLFWLGFFSARNCNEPGWPEQRLLKDGASYGRNENHSL